jgi:hypothetical protein
LSKKVKALREVALKIGNSRNQAAVARELDDFQRGLAELEDECRCGQEAAVAELQEAMADLAL